MAVAYASSTEGSETGDGNLVMTKPTGLASGDVLVAFCTRETDGANTGSFNTPAGWTLIDSTEVANDIYGAVFTKIADSSDAAASSFTFVPSVAGDNSAGILVRVTGAAFTSVVGNIVGDTSSDASTGGENAVSFAGIDPLGGSCLLLMFLVNRDSSFDVAFSGYAVANNNPSWTEAHDFEGNNSSLAMAYGSYASGNVTGNYSAVVNQDGDYVGALVAVTETVSVTVSPAVITATATVQAPSVSAGATVSPAVITATITVQAPTVSTADPDWRNTDKTDTNPTITNTSKS